MVLVGAVLAAGGYAARHPDLLDRIDVRGTVRAVAPSAPAPDARPTPTPVPAAGRVAPGIGYPARGDGTFRTADTVGAVAGRSGELLRYRVAVEDGIPWPLVDGEPLSGPSGQYDDPIPAGDR
ncbi:hypothetical protein [Micromonospora aurantiaca (nom. illeg.)]|uniref:hypothetical protein n=1 Tax=Micromonospora aurantiaca (nom. illeg.) TaxID=47850 RepID=UPI00340023C6